MPLSADYVNPLHKRNKHSVSLPQAAVLHQRWDAAAAIDDDGFIEDVLGPDDAGTAEVTLDAAL